MSKILLARFALIAAVLLTTGLSAEPATAPAPTGQLVIQSALFGDLENDKTVDVTRKLTSLVKDGNLSVVASSKTFGDPAPGAAKKLKVGYTLDGIYRSKTVEEDQTLDISTRLLIRRAVYGALPNGPLADVTEQVAGMIRKNTLSVRADNEQFGDPANGVVKRLRVDYTFDGKEKSKSVEENQTLAISEKGE